METKKKLNTKKNKNRKYLPNYHVLLRTKGSKKKNEKLVIKQVKKQNNTKRNKKKQEKTHL